MIISGLALKIKENAIYLVVNQIDKKSDIVIDFNAFCQYFPEQVLNKEGTHEDTRRISQTTCREKGLAYESIIP